MRFRTAVLGCLTLLGAFKLSTWCAGDPPNTTTEEVRESEHFFVIDFFASKAICNYFHTRMVAGELNQGCSHVNHCADARIDLYRTRPAARCHFKLKRGELGAFRAGFHNFTRSEHSLWISLQGGYTYGTSGTGFVHTSEDASQIVDIRDFPP